MRDKIDCDRHAPATPQIENGRSRVQQSHEAVMPFLELGSPSRPELSPVYSFKADDAAQESGEIQKPGGGSVSIVSKQNNAAKVSDVGLTRKQIHDARQSATQSKTGIVRCTQSAAA